ncbi:MAG TPA: BatA domain-containing protein, partial [Longimicrobiales bacterium]|nr:BatA domain-containing protein [Longimicrobiales bacterium]
MAFARPWVLWLGAGLAVGVVLLHMLRHHPGPRLPLPTARFLVADRRTRLRLFPPSHAALLAARLGALAALALAAASPTLSDRRDGELLVVALDAGAGMAPAWSAAVDSARAALDAGAARLVVFDSAAVPLEASALDSLRGAGPSGATADYRAAFRGLREAAGRSRADAFEAVLITTPRAAAWRRGSAPTRDAAWPAPIRVLTPDRSPAGGPSEGESGGAAPALRDPERGAPGAAAAGPGTPPPGPGTQRPPAVRVVGADAARSPYLAAALASLGVERVEPGGAAGGSGAPDPGQALLVAPGAQVPEPDGTVTEGVIARWGTLDGAASDAFGWLPDARSEIAAEPGPVPTPALLVEAAPWTGADGPLVIDGPFAVRAGAPGPGARVWAVTAEGRAAGVALGDGGGCRTYFAGDLLDARLVASPDFPAVVDRLLRGCADGAKGDAPAGAAGLRAAAGDLLGTGALAFLEGASRDAATAESLGLRADRPVGRLLLAAALALLLLEIALGARAASASAPPALARAASGER